MKAIFLAIGLLSSLNLSASSFKVLCVKSESVTPAFEAQEKINRRIRSIESLNGFKVRKVSAPTISSGQKGEASVCVTVEYE